tara:strand:- start:125 stop:502 length:378 start_codon:yes stop_codon:yes gene_type:complete
MKKIEQIIISSLIVGILSLLYISMPPTNYFLTSSEHSFSSTNQFEEVHTEYIGKVVDIKGVITSVSEEVKFTNIILDSSFLFSIETINLNKTISENDVIIIKGRFIGFDIDNLFEPYSFTDCSIQ